jgi:hypothetical protein
MVANMAVNVYGVPWIIGAKKGFPNFNEFSMENMVGVTRRLQFTRTTNSSPPVITGTNQMYTISISSSLGAELWNSYNSVYPNPVTVVLRESISMTLTNDDPGFQWLPLAPMTFSTNISFLIDPLINPWQGNLNSASFFIPLNVAIPMLTNSVYRSPYANAACLPPGFFAPCLIPTNNFNVINQTPLLFEVNSPNGFHFPQFGLLTTNRLQVFMLDSTNGVYHVIDYVHFAGPDSSFNLNSAIADLDNNNTVFSPNTVGVWNTNYPPGQLPPNGVTWGVIKQILVSKAGQPPSEDGTLAGDAQAFQLGGTPPQQQASFAAFFKPVGSIDTAPGWGIYGQATASNVLLSVQAPYTPTRYAVQYLTWQANDPLVHYLASDIASTPLNTTTTPKPGLSHVDPGDIIAALTNLNLGKKNDRYFPWGSNPGSVDPINMYNPAERDPQVRQSDDWDFPSYKFPTVGWLGRVHRGTPWQTVYLKASDVLTESNLGTNTWAQWTGDMQLTFNQYFDAINTAPVQDRLLFDLFTTAFNDNATRGTLSVNVGANGPSLAAWSALFSGIIVPTNTIVGYTIIQPAGPAGSSSLLGELVANINSTRAAFTNSDGLVGTFEHVGDILATPELTVSNQWILLNNTNTANGISDEMYEWLPQQTMSLLRCADSPRYVIYCYGQALKPAPNGIYTGSGQFFGMVTNYQVVSEIATRAVVRFGSSLTNVVTSSVIFTNGVNVTNWFSQPVVTNNNAVIESFNLLPPD